MTKTVGIYLRLPPKDLKRLQKLADLKGVTVQTLLRMEVKSLLSGFVDGPIDKQWEQEQEAS